MNRLETLFPNITYLALVAVGLVFVNSWPDLVGHGSEFAASAALVSDALTNPRVFFSAGLGSVGLLYGLAPRLSRFDIVTGLAVAALGVLVTSAFAWCPQVEGALGVALGAAAAFGVGFGHGWFLVHLLAHLAQCTNMTSMVCAGLTGLLVKTLLNPVFGALPGAAQVVVTRAMPPALLVVWIALQRTRERDGMPLDLAEFPKASEASSRTLLCLLFMDAILHATTRSMSTLGFWGSDYSFALPAFLEGVVALAGLLVAVRYTMPRDAVADHGVLARFLPSFLTLLGGFFLLDDQVAELLGMDKDFSAALSIAVELYAHLLYWVVIVTAARELHGHPLRPVGLAVATMCATSIVISLVLQLEAQLTNLVMMVVMYALAGMMLMLFNDAQKKTGAVGGPAATGSTSDLTALCDTLASDYGLTPRETEVFQLLAQGRDRAFIKGELFISDATIKTHCQRIYAKLGVHNKQELISFVQQAHGR